ncbi:hypothetical protein JCM17042A_01850 [Ruminococcus champanellensis 18P13 = JCM 17042]
MELVHLRWAFSALEAFRSWGKRPARKGSPVRSRDSAAWEAFAAWAHRSRGKRLHRVHCLCRSFYKAYKILSRQCRSVPLWCYDYKSTPETANCQANGI